MSCKNLPYHQVDSLPLADRGASSFSGVKPLIHQLPALFEKYHIKSMFDAGANDAAWQRLSLNKMFDYYAGEINPYMVKIAHKECPEVRISVHDATEDPFPNVDLLFVRDVTIHLSNFYKKCLLNNWLSSNIPWILMTQIPDIDNNKEVIHGVELIPEAEVNWRIDPWNFPEETDYVRELFPPGRRMSLWHRDQLKDLL